MIDYRYPIGKYQPEPYSKLLLAERLQAIAELPEKLAAAIEGLTAEQLATPYRDGGWTVTQVVHHVADSHMNAFIRFRLGLTEDNPTIKPYMEKEWALLPDVATVPVGASIALLRPLHERLLATVSNLTEQQWERTLVHPESQMQMTLWFLLGLYAWHGKHHTAHITSLRERNNW